MKTKKVSKFNLEKFEVAKLKNNAMKKIQGGEGQEPITGTGRQVPKPTEPNL